MCPVIRKYLRIVTTLNNQWDEVKNILQRNWNILTNDYRTASFIPEKPQLMATRGRNIKDCVIKSHFTCPQVSLGRGTELCGMFPCAVCSTCPVSLTKAEFVNPTEDQIIKLRDDVNCRSRHVVYGFLCSCPKIYLGQTGQELRKRVQQHLASIAIAKRYSNMGNKLGCVHTCIDPPPPI